MVNRIGSTPSALPLAEPVSAPPAADGFADAFERAVDGVNKQQLKADDALYALATGQTANLHSTMIALEEANIALRTMASTRDKIVEAYQQIWNMPI
jgi:flagellar hook-basal body complex protein FliE